MKISYELNPPKIVKGERFDIDQLCQDMAVLKDRAVQIARYADSIHLTDSVLGIPRVSSVTSAGQIMESLESVKAKNTRITCSLRVRDRNFVSICQSVSDAIFIGVDGLLLLMGDEPADKPANSGLKPSTAVKMLRHEGYDAKIKLSLSVPARIKNVSASLQNKIAARPYSFVTQSISSLSDLGEIVDIAKPYSIRVTACIMVPSEKNRYSANMIGLDWKEYSGSPVDFIKQAAKTADEVLLTSPNSFSSGLELLNELRK